jgi:hypothetical protein
MYVNGKMKPVETFAGMRGEGMKVNDRGGEFSYDISKCIPSTTIVKLNLDWQSSSSSRESA